MGYALSNSTEKKINEVHEKMMTRNEFADFSTGISEDLHQKTSTLGHSIRQGIQHAMLTHTLAIIIGIAIMLWTIVLGSVATYRLNHQLTDVQNQLVNIETSASAQALSYEIALDEKMVQIGELEGAVRTLTAELTAANARITDLETVAATPVPVIINYTDMTHKSGLTAEQFDAVISAILEKYKKGDTQLTGLGQALYDMENEYDINGFLALGISGIESGWGRSKLAVNHNNLYGLIGMSFDSTYDCTLYFGKLMRNHYIDEGRTSLASISKKYCEGNAKWVSDVSWFIGIYTDMAKSMYTE